MPYRRTSEEGFQTGPSSRSEAFTYDLLCELTGSNINRYGILTGMRPVKLVHRLFDQGLTPAQIEQRLLSEYRLEAEKARLLVEIASANRPYLHSADEAGQWVSVYLGIPYCPSRCYYCSFPGAVVKDYEADIVPFLEALFQEIRAISACLREQGLKVQTVYLGGAPLQCSPLIIWSSFLPSSEPAVILASTPWRSL